jgi:monofunctional glycosyltransferase
MKRAIARWGLLVLIAFIALQLFFVLRIATMLVMDPQSTSFERSEAWRVLHAPDKPFAWGQQWVDYAQISDPLKRAVIASEDSDFIYHYGVDWEAIERAWKRNAKAEIQAVKRSRSGKIRAPKVVGGSTITQQLAKNLFLSGERNLLRKGQEFVLTVALELLLPKERILEIYLNSVEWGEGIFGAEAAAQHYFQKPAAKLSNYEAARLAVMLPSPKTYENTFNASYLRNRAQTIMARMADAELP